MRLQTGPSTAVLWAAIVLFSLPAATPALGTLTPPAPIAHASAGSSRAQRPAAGQIVADDRAFGFRLREERRYTLGPPGLLGAGDSELWSIRLQSIDIDDESRRAHFRLEHEATRVVGSSGFSGGSEMTAFYGVMDLTVNEFGFPLRIEYRADRDDPRVLGRAEAAGVIFTGSRFHVANPYAMGVREIDVAIPSEPYVDLSVPRGVYLAGYENPGLFSLVLAGAGIQEAREVPYVALAPSLFAGARDVRAGSRRGVYRASLEFDGYTTVDIGGSRRPTMRLQRERGGYVYVEEDGTVLRVDITTGGGERAWFRLLRPSEY